MFAAAVDDHGAHAYGAHESDIFQDALVHALFSHGGATVFDHDDTVLELLDVWKGLDEDFGLFYGFLHDFIYKFLFYI